MLFTWILPMSLLAGFISQINIQSPKMMTKADQAQSVAKFVPDPNAPPVITQGSGTR
jgi:hypothetical protein